MKDLTLADLYEPIQKAGDRALRAVRPGSDTHTAFTVFLTQLQTAIEEKNHELVEQETKTAPAAAPAPRDGSGT